MSLKAPRKSLAALRACVEVAIGRLEEKAAPRDVPTLEALCGKGDLEACVDLAAALELKSRTKEDRLRVRKLLDATCVTKRNRKRRRTTEGPGCAALARYHYDKMDPQIGWTLDKKWMERGYEAAHAGCRDGDADACALLFPFRLRLGLQNPWNSVGVKNFPGGRLRGKYALGYRQIERESCERGSALGCAMVAKGLAEDNIPQGREILELLCDAGAVSGCELQLKSAMAMMQRSESKVGEGARQALSPATNWHERLIKDCKAGSEKSCQLAKKMMKEKRKKVDDEPEALGQFRALLIERCTAGHMASCTKAAGASRDDVEKAELLQRACDHQFDCHLVGALHQDSEDETVQDFTKAAKILAGACGWQQSYCKSADAAAILAPDLCAEHLLKKYKPLRKIPRDKLSLKLGRYDSLHLIGLLRRCESITSASKGVKRKLSRRRAGFEKVFVKCEAALGVGTASSTKQGVPPAEALQCVRATCGDCATKAGLGRFAFDRDRCLAAMRDCMNSCGCKWMGCGGKAMCCP